jgi:hypothetical protein
MSTTSLSNALRNQIRGEAAKQSNLTESQRAALRTWSRRQQRLAKAADDRVGGAPSGTRLWL